MHIFERPFYYREGAEPGGGSEASVTPPSAAPAPAPSAPAAAEPVATAPRALGSDWAAAIEANRMPVGDVVPKPVAPVAQETAPVTETPAPAAIADEAPGAEAVPVVAAAATATDAAVTSTNDAKADDLLLQAAALLDIKETDPVKIREAIEVKKQEQSTKTQEQQEAQDREYEAAAIKKIDDESRETVMKMAEPGLADSVRSQMRAEGFQVDQEGWWLAETWDDEGGTYGPTMLARYNELKEIATGRLRNSDEWNRAITNEKSARQSAFNDEKAKLASLAENYQFHDKTLVAEFRRSGADAAAIERVAQLSHANAERINSTINSELNTTKAKLTAAEGQIASHAKAIDDAYQRGRNEAAQEHMQPNPATLGIDSTADQGTGTVWRGGRRYAA